MKNSAESNTSLDNINKNLIFLYGLDKGKKTFQKLQEIIIQEQKIIQNTTNKKNYFSEKDIALITYADSFSENDKAPLKTLETFLTTYLQDTINIVHILPFFPFTSDRGFSIVDFYSVKKEFGTWDDIKKFTKKHRLMADLVLNHVSTKNIWFQKFLEGDSKYQDYFISYTKEEVTESLKKELQKVFRPRNTPILTEFETAQGKRYVWTTFSVGTSTDQVDLNYQNPKVLLEVLKVYLFLLRQGVRVIRMDAITYIWKEIGTECVHMPQGYAILEIFRDIVKIICSSALLITETNVPHKENISYFLNGEKGTHMVYNFALPPFVLHAFYSKNAEYLTTWVETLRLPSPRTTLFNFLASHDGIGILGARGILPDKEIDLICKTATANGAKLKYKALPNGESTVYDICATWWSAMNNDKDPFDIALKKFITSYAICFALAGMPAVYYLSLFGEENDLDVWGKTQQMSDIREILRKNLDYSVLHKQLKNENTKEAKVMQSFRELVEQRKSHPAFHPNADQTVLSLDKRVFALLRESPTDTILALHNVSGDEVTVRYKGNTYTLAPYAFLWQPLGT